MVDIASPSRLRKGIFARWQPIYAEHRIATFPLNEEKRPHIKRWQTVGIRGSVELANKFTEAEALGFVTGKRSGVTILDIDTPDENVTADAIARHGEPRIITRTASGKHHLFYRYDGEGRRIRPWDGLDIDVLGDNGFAVGAPSKLTKGSYEIVRGTLDDLAHLQPMEGVAASLRGNKAAAGLQIGRAPPAETGARNNSLYRACMRQAHGCTTFDDLLAFARETNVIYSPPLQETEVMNVAKSAWDYTERGQNRFGQHGAWFPVDEVAAMLQYQDAFVLLAFLRAHEGPQATFMIANGLAEKFGWPRQRLAAARGCLIELGYVEQIRRAATGLPALFRWI